MGRLANKVRNGMLLLDMHVPGWYAKINLAELNLGSCVNCVLGQLFERNYYKGGVALFGDFDKNGRKGGLMMGFFTAPFGFDSPEFLDERVNSWERKLNRIWRRAITTRVRLANEYKEKTTTENDSTVVSLQTVA